jgi:site-specific DNA recombinase
VTVRIYLRRSKSDEGHQQFSLDVQRRSSLDFATQFPGAPSEEYVDDGLAGDDFVGRRELQRLLKDTQKGDIIIARDQHRLGRDALEVTLVIRTLTKERGARVLYYSDGQEAKCDSVIEQTITFIRGVGGQMELEAIRSRVREALRDRVKQGFIAGGKCYGYRNEPTADATDPTRVCTKSFVEPQQAEIVRRIFAERQAGAGIKRIAIGLNADHVPSPWAGRRGSGTWSPACISELLRRERYRGVYVHGKIDRPRRNGKRLTVKADPSKVLRVEIPEWRIVDDETWFAVQSRMAERLGERKAPGPASKYPLSGIGKCAHCGGAIGVEGKRVGKESVGSYGCGYHKHRGSAVCPVSTRQPRREVEDSLADYLLRQVFTEAVISQMVADARAEIERRLAEPSANIREMELDLRKIEKEMANLAKAVALGGDIPELLSELQQRQRRAAHRGPRCMPRSVPQRCSERRWRRRTSTCGGGWRPCENARGQQGGRPGGLPGPVPDGLKFSPVEIPGTRRRVWKIEGDAKLGSAHSDATPAGFEPAFSP